MVNSKKMPTKKGEQNQNMLKMSLYTITHQYGVPGGINTWGGAMLVVIATQKCRLVWVIKENNSPYKDNTKSRNKNLKRS